MNQNSTPVTIKTILALVCAVSLAVSFRAAAQGTVTFSTFTYQGRLTADFLGGQNDDPRLWEFSFKAVIPPTPCADPIDCPWRTNCANCAKFDLGTNFVLVDKGLFTTYLKIPTPPPFPLDSSNGVFLEIAVRTNSSQPFTVLSPLQPLTATPFATLAQSVVGPIPASLLTGAMPTGMLTGVFSSPVTFNNSSNIFAGDGSLLTHLQASNLIGTMPTGMLTGTFGGPVNFSNPANRFAGDGSLLTNISANTIRGLDPCSLTCYWNILGNSGTDPSANFLGTTDDRALTLKVHNQVVMRYFPHPDGPDGGNLVGGAFVNAIGPGSAGSVIGGGGAPGLANVISNDHSAILGGVANVVFGRESVVGGGWGNRNDDFNSHCAVISGGSNNVASLDFGAIGGGVNNSVRGHRSVIAGGQNNRVVAPDSAISGGMGNAIIGETSVIAGGVANHIGVNDGNGDYAGRTSFIGGGSSNTIAKLQANQAAEWDVVAGGHNNSISGLWSVVGGGDYNSVTGDRSTIGGGALNLVNSDGATVAGGVNNLASYAASVGGGWSNTAAGIAATIPGGSNNVASGATSFAAGYRAKATNDGAFVWSDAQTTDFSSTANNQFAVRAQNGVMIQGSTTTLDLRGNGAIRVAGAGVASSGPVFIHRATAGNISGHITTIDHPLANGDANAILLVTHNYSADTSATPYETNTVGVWYNGSKWTIFHENTGVAMPVGRAFNVMIIKP